MIKKILKGWNFEHKNTDMIECKTRVLSILIITLGINIQYVFKMKNDKRQKQTYVCNDFHSL